MVLKLAHHPAGSARPAADGSRAPSEAAAGPSSAPAASVTAAATPAAVPSPFDAATAAFLGGRSGTVLAAVYDLRTSQTWTVGTGTPQDEASVVKLDILETLLAQRSKTGATLSASDSSLAQNMIEESDNDDAQDLWNSEGGATAVGTFDAAVVTTGGRIAR